jgi:hypothetical protein
VITTNTKEISGIVRNYFENLYSPSYADFRSRANAAMWLDLDCMIRGEHISVI